MGRELAPSGFDLFVHAEPHSVQAAFLRRVMRALERIAGSVPATLLTDALEAPTDVGSLARILSRSEIVGSAITELDPLVPALARNAEHRETLLKLAGGAVSADDAGKTLGITRQAVDKRRRAGALLAVREGSDWRYPSCQFAEGETIPGITEVVRGLSAAGPWATLDFLLAPDTALRGKTPLQALQSGDRDEVMRLVRADRGDGFA